MLALSTTVSSQSGRSGTIPAPTQRRNFRPPRATLFNRYSHQVHVSDGQQVGQGDLLVTLRSDELLLELAEIISSIAKREQELKAALAAQNALEVSLPEIGELERRLNRSLCTRLPKALFRKSRRIAVDLTLVAYHGQPHRDKKEIYRSSPKSGTTHFYAYATVAVVHKGHRYPLVLLRVEHGTKMKDMVARLLKIVRSRGVNIQYLLVGKGFFCVEVIACLKRARLGFILPVMARGRKP